MSCTGCLKTLSSMDVVLGYQVCWDCTVARQKACTSNGCKCRKADKRVKRLEHLGRVFYRCERCLGSVKGA